MGLGKKKILIFLDFFVEGGGKGSEKGESDGWWERAGFAGAAQERGRVGDEDDVRSGIRDSKFQSSAPTSRDLRKEVGCEPRRVGM